MVVFSLSLGGCSFFNGQSAKKQEMIQIAESKKMKVAIEKYFKKQDPEALTPNGKIKTYRILKDKLKYNTINLLFFIFFPFLSLVFLKFIIQNSINVRR